MTPFWVLSNQPSEASARLDGETLVLENRYLRRRITGGRTVSITDGDGVEALSAPGREGSFSADGVRYELKGPCRVRVLDGHLTEKKFDYVPRPYNTHPHPYPAPGRIAELCWDFGELEARLRYEIFDDMPVIRKSLYVENKSGRTVVIDAAETEALVSDVFLALWRSRAKLRDEGIASYLIAIARNRAGSYLRKKRREIPVDPADMTETPDNGELPEDAAERKLLAESLLEALDEETRKLFVRHYYFGQTVEDASRELGMNLSTAKSRLVRGREKLNRLLEGENKRERRREKRHGNAF